MRFIDDKGRLLGLINLIDLLVVAAIVSVIVSLAANIPSADRNKKVMQEMYIKVLCRVPNEVASNKEVLKTGDAVLGGNARVETVLERRPIVDSGATNTGFSYIVVLIKAKCVVLNGEYYCANIPIKINANIIFSGPTYTFGSATIDTSVATIIDFYKAKVKDRLPEGGVNG